VELVGDLKQILAFRSPIAFGPGERWQAMQWDIPSTAAGGILPVLQQFKRHSTTLQAIEFSLESVTEKGISTNEESLVTDNL